MRIKYSVLAELLDARPEQTKGNHSLISPRQPDCYAVVGACGHAIDVFLSRDLPPAVVAKECDLIRSLRCSECCARSQRQEAA